MYSTNEALSTHKVELLNMAGAKQSTLKFSVHFPKSRALTTRLTMWPIQYKRTLLSNHVLFVKSLKKASLRVTLRVIHHQRRNTLGDVVLFNY